MLTCLATVVVALRIYARAGIMKIMGHEDWAILVALVSLARKSPEHLLTYQAFAIVYLALVACRKFIDCSVDKGWILTIPEAVHGMGIHMDRLSPEVSQEQLKASTGREIYKHGRTTNIQPVSMGSYPPI